jgi:xylan 1,4-beta-xylosidase
LKNSMFEFVEPEDHLPFEVSLHSVNYIPSHWHTSVEIIVVLQGKLEVTVADKRHFLSEGDVLLINQSLVHEVVELGVNIIATYLIPLTYLKSYHVDAESFNFHFDSQSIDKEKKQYMDKIRQKLAEMIQLKYKKNEGYELDMQIHVLSVFSILLKQFRIPASSRAVNEKYLERMLRIVSFLEEHYKETVTLQEVAEREYLSVPYLSKFFSENFGLNFQAYLTSIRLKNTVAALLENMQIPAADIAMNHGFPSAKSFYTAFKHKYHMSPNQYRKQYASDSLPKRDFAPSTNYMAFNQVNALGIVQQLLRRTEQATQDMEVSAQEHEQVSVRLSDSEQLKPILHTWRNLITIGKAKEGLHADVQQQLRRVQQTCPFRYLRFHGIFDDAMMVYQELQGESVYNFRFVDQLFDFLLSIGLKPFIELGFMPSSMAKDNNKRVFFRESYVSGPKSLAAWGRLIDRFLRHCLNRYGEGEVTSWKFEFWNEPQLPQFWPGTFEEYCEFYEHTYRVIKQCSPLLQIGAPGTMISMDTLSINERFFSFCKEQDCTPDFIPLHFYPHETFDELLAIGRDTPLATQARNSFDRITQKSIALSANSNLLKEKLENEQAILMGLQVDGKELFLTEWNSTSFHRDLTNDTLYKAAYIVKNIVDNLDAISGFGYWVLSDNIEESFASSHLYHGGLGLFTQYGIPKAGMVAYELLAQLGDRLISRGERYVLTSGRSGYQLLIFNYCHFDDLYAMGDISFIDSKNRYNAFKDVKTVKLEFSLSGLPKGKYRIVTRTLNRRHGSSYDKWVEMGAPDHITSEDVDYLKSMALPQKSIRTEEIDQNIIYISTLEPHNVQLMELYPVL